MNTYYTLKNGSKITLYMWEDFLRNDIWRGFAEVRTVKNNIHSKHYSKKKLFKDDKGIYIVWDSQKVYLNDFDYTPYSELMQKIKEGQEKNDRWYVREDEVWATFYKEFEKVFVVADMPVYDTIISMMGIGLCSDKTVPTLCKLSERHYDKYQMSYKLTLVPENETVAHYVASQDYYFSDFSSMLHSGIFSLVDPDEYKAELQRKIQEEEERENNKSGIQKFVERFKKSNKQDNYTVFVYN